GRPRLGGGLPLVGGAGWSGAAPMRLACHTAPMISGLASCELLHKLSLRGGLGCIERMNGAAPISGASRVFSRFVASRVAAPNGARQGAGRRQWESLGKSRNAAWHHLARNPSGRAWFFAMPAFSSLICHEHTALLVACL